MISSSSFQSHLSVAESAAAGRVPDEFVALKRSVREVGAADDLTDMIETCAGVGIACLYGSRAAIAWVSYIPDPTMASMDAIGRIAHHTGTCGYLPLFTIRGAPSDPVSSLGCIGDGYVHALSSSCREIEGAVVSALAECMRTSGAFEESAIDAAVHQYVSEHAGEGMQALAEEFLCHVGECYKIREYSA